MQYITKTEKFKFWCQKTLPLVYDDSLSYYELLNKVVDYLNHTIEDVNTLGGDFVELHKMYNELKDYVDNYFKNLDVQSEINNKLDSMADDGTLDEIINVHIFENLNTKIDNNTSEINSTKDRTTSLENDIKNYYETTSEMENTTLRTGAYAVVYNPYSVYKIVDSEPQGKYIVLSDGRYALLLTNPTAYDFNIEPNVNEDMTSRIQDYINASDYIEIPKGEYHVTKLEIPTNKHFNGNGSTIIGTSNADSTRGIIQVKPNEIYTLLGSYTLPYGTESITVANATNIKVGDTLFISATDTWNKPYDESHDYKAGEIQTVEKVIGNTIYFATPILEQYTNANVYLTPMVTSTIENMVVIAESGNYRESVRVAFGRGCVIKNVTARAMDNTNQQYAIGLFNSLNTTVDNIVAINDNNLANRYGFIGCQVQGVVITNSYFRGRNHGCTFGMGGEDGSTMPIVNRYMKLANCTFDAITLNGFDTHGNCEQYIIENSKIVNGINLGGQYGKVDNCKISIKDGSAIVTLVRLAEYKGCNFAITNNYFDTSTLDKNNGAVLGMASPNNTYAQRGIVTFTGNNVRVNHLEYAFDLYAPTNTSKIMSCNFNDNTIVSTRGFGQSPIHIRPNSTIARMSFINSTISDFAVRNDGTTMKILNNLAQVVDV